MKKPALRPKPLRTSDYDRNRLHSAPPNEMLNRLAETAKYRGSSKHKASPMRFNLPLFVGDRGDATLCDEDANFQPDQMASMPRLLQRGIKTGLVGKVMVQGIPSRIWTVADDGWIFEARITNPGQSEYHGYPVRTNEAIAESVYLRFAEWACLFGDDREVHAAANCKVRYGFKK